MKAIFFEAHNDDIVIGVGGTLIKLLNLGVEVKCVCLTDGRYGSEKISPEETKVVRAEEASAERKFLGIKDFEDFNIEDGTLSKLSETEKASVIKRVSDILDSYKPDFIFTPSASEMHADHRSVHDFIMEAIQNSEIKPAAIKYFVWNFPDFYKKRQDVADKIFFVDMSNEFQKKLEALRLHKSQINEGRYDEWIEHQNALTALQFKTYKISGGKPPKFGEIIGAFGSDNKTDELKKILSAEDITKIFHGRADQKIEM